MITQALASLNSPLPHQNKIIRDVKQKNKQQCLAYK